ncbi:hypothetical protein [Streptomyces cavernae]|nr:hypothetical protein [Streptomyces cavernae]
MTGLVRGITGSWFEPSGREGERMVLWAVDPEEDTGWGKREARDGR